MSATSASEIRLWGGLNVVGKTRDGSIQGFTTREVARIIGLSEARVRGWVRVGLINPRRSARRRLAFSFRDLVVLRASKGLIDEQIPAPKVRRILHALRRQLPRGQEITGISVYVEGDRVVVCDGRNRWQPESGQLMLNFEAASLLRRAARRPAMPLPRRGLHLTASQWHDLAAELEAGSPNEARAAYQQALALDSSLAPAHVNLGRLLHAQRDLCAAEKHYRAALRLDDSAGTAAFNLGVLLEDMGRATKAEEAYRRALAADADLADAHYNLALLYETRGRKREALRHLHVYRRLTGRQRRHR